MKDALLAELNTSQPLRKLSGEIERLPLSADTKALLLDLAKVTVNVGATVLKIGSKILSVVFEITRKFPNTVFGVVVSVGVGLLIGSIPVIGGVLTPFLVPLLLAFGLTKGAIADLANASWADRIRDLESKLASVAA